MSMKHYAITTALAIGGLLLCTATAQQGQANRMKMSSADQTFVTKAYQGGMAEVEVGKLATEKASNPKVKQFGQRMVDDHTKANEELKSIASNKGLSLPGTLDASAEATKTRLSNKNGGAFDLAYMEDMVKDHQHDVAEFQREANHGSDPDVKAFAAKTLPTLQEHLKLAQETLAEVKKGSTR